MTTILSTFPRRLAAALAIAVLVGACTLEKQSTPALSGPSGLALSLVVAATPEVLPRDGASVSTISISTQDMSLKPVRQRVIVSASAGTLSSSDVTTDANGRATVEFTAPPLNQGSKSATITVSPVDSINASNQTSLARSVTIALTGPSVPVAAFSFSPTSPGQYDSVTFDASGVTVDGAACNGNCTYAWDFGDGSTASGQVAAHRYTSRGTFLVTLTVTAPGGTTATKTASITVGAPKTITATIAVSPTDPTTGETVYFDGSSSTTPDGATITSYQWDFGNGGTANTAKATTTYSLANTYTVRLTITDDLGRTATTTATVTVKKP